MTNLLNSIKQVLNEEKQNLEEKSVSQSQQKLMGMAYALKKGEMEEKDASPEVKKLAASMTLKDLKDFASTKHDEIPAKKEEVELDEAYRWSTINRACTKLNMSPRQIANLLSALKKVNGASSGDDETYTWSTINKACMKLNMSPREIANLLSALKKVNEEVELDENKRKNINAKFSPNEQEAIRKALDAAVDHWDGKAPADYMTSLKRMAKRDKNWTFNTDEVQFMYDAIVKLPKHAKIATMLKRKLSGQNEEVELDENKRKNINSKFSPNEQEAIKYDPSFFKEGVEVDGRTKAFKATMKRIEAYKVKKKSIKTEETEYQKFFKSALKKFNVSSPDELEGKKEKEFYDYVDANWKAKDESVIDKVNKIVNEKRKERMEKIMQECDEPQSGNDKKLVKFHKDNTKKISE